MILVGHPQVINLDLKSGSINSMISKTVSSKSRNSKTGSSTSRIAKNWYQ
jgi:hypothetical protein